MLKKSIVRVAIVIAAIAVFFGLNYAVAETNRLDVERGVYQAFEQMDGVVSTLDAEDSEQIITAARDLQATASGLANTVNKPWWSIAAMIPRLGNKLEDTRELANSFDDVVFQIVTPLVTTLRQEPLKLVSDDGSINVAAIQAYLISMSEVSPSFDRCIAALQTIQGRSSDEKAAYLQGFVVKLSTASRIFAAEETLDPFLPDILGMNGTRHYLIVMDSSAQTRAAGGQHVVTGLLTVDNGKLSTENMGPVALSIDATLPENARQNPAEASLFGNEAASSLETGTNPHFPRTAASLASAYESRNGTHVDGVIGVTPATIQDILGVTSSITLSDGTLLNGANAVATLEHDLSIKYQDDPDRVSELMAEALIASVGSIANDKPVETVVRLMTSFIGCINNRTLMLWLSDTFEQTQSSSLDWSGSISSSSAYPALGVYLNINDDSKMGWYLYKGTYMRSQTVNPDGSCTYLCRTTIANRATQSIIADEGDALGCDPQGNVPITLYLVGPARGTISNLESDIPFANNLTYYKHCQVITIEDIVLAPDETITFDYAVTTATWAVQEMTIKTSPSLTVYRMY